MSLSSRQSAPLVRIEDASVPEVEQSLEVYAPWSGDRFRGQAGPGLSADEEAQPEDGMEKENVCRHVLDIVVYEMEINRIYCICKQEVKHFVAISRLANISLMAKLLTCA